MQVNAAEEKSKSTEGEAGPGGAEEGGGGGTEASGETPAPPPFPHVFGTRQPAASTGSSQPRQPGTELPPAEVNLVPCQVVEMVQLRRGLGRQPL